MNRNPMSYTSYDDAELTHEVAMIMRWNLRNSPKNDWNMDKADMAAINELRERGIYERIERRAAGATG